MTKDKVTVRERVHSDLFKTPHVVDKILSIVTGEWQTDEPLDEQLVYHLTECNPCRGAIAVLLTAMQQDEQPRSSADIFINTLLTKLANINHQIESQKFEQLGAYAEAIQAEGRKEAERRFPQLVEHIKNCSTCKLTLEATLTFLKTSEEKE